MLIVKKFGGTSVGDKERIFNVARRCIEDYKLLKEKNLASYVSNEIPIGKEEIRAFLQSQYCDFLLQNMNLTGKDILDYLDRE